MKDKIAMKIAWMLPRRIVMWCAFRVGAHATQGEYSNQVVPELTFMDAMKRFETHTMTIIRMPNRRMASQRNRKRDWPIGLFSPQDGTPVRLDTDTREIRDDHGNVIPADTMAGNRPWQIFRRWLRQNFGTD